MLSIRLSKLQRFEVKIWIILPRFLARYRKVNRDVIIAYVTIYMTSHFLLAWRRVYTPSGHAAKVRATRRNHWWRQELWGRTVQPNHQKTVINQFTEIGICIQKSKEYIHYNVYLLLWTKKSKISRDIAEIMMIY